MLAGSHLKKGLFFFFRWAIWKGTILLANIFFPEDHNIFIQRCGFFCTLECVFMRKITAQILITLHDFTIIAAVHDLPSHKAVLICQCRRPPPWQSLLSVPVRVFWGGHGPGHGAEPIPRGLGVWGLWEGEINERLLIELGGQIPCLASALRPTHPAPCALWHSHGWAQIWSAPRTAELLSSKKTLYEAHSGVSFCQPQAQHRAL